MVTILTFLGQALVYWFFTIPRTIGTGGLALYFLIGALLFFLRSIFWMILQGSGPTHSQAFVISVVDVLLLSLPVYWLFFKSRAGHGANLMDGIALGAFLGIGYGLNFLLHLPSIFGSPSFLTWTMGSIGSDYPTIVPDSGHHVVWSGYAIWGALVGFSFAFARRLSNRIQPWLCWSLPALIILLAFLEVLVFTFFHTGLVAHQNMWRSISSWFYWLDSSGRQGRLFLAVLYLGSFAAGEYLFHSCLPFVKQFLLKGEPQTPNIASEIIVAARALRYGFSAFVEVRSFFRSRRRLVTFLTKQRWLARDDTQLSRDIMLAEDQLAEKLGRAEAALAGELVRLDDSTLGSWQMAKQFSRGLLLTLLISGLYIFLVAWLGRLISARSGNEVIGYIYATLIVTALAYAIAYFREQIFSWVLTRIGALTKRDQTRDKTL